MLFNSYQFLLLFLPATLVGYYLLAATRWRPYRHLFLSVATLAFYALAAVQYLPLLLGSVVGNYAFAVLIARTAGRLRHLVLTIGVLLNLGALFYFKYTGFLFDNLNASFGAGLPSLDILLPLGISFFTFQQIAFLVDASRDLVPTNRPASYFASILFFPIIVSGPITLYRELSPQFDREPQRGSAMGNILIGTVIFALGLFKKTVIADSLLLWVDPLFAQAAAGAHPGLLGGWCAAVGYLLQMYFDFSGYSDMALGVARMFGILLPLNFFSPIRSTNIMDWWRRWHMTLGRWVNVYIFKPLALPMTRWAAARSLGKKGTFAVGTIAPTILTMVIIGAWHGGNWTFFVFGALHAFYMAVAESWRFARRKKRKGKAPTRIGMAAGNLLTLAAVFVAVVPFRAPDMATATRIWGGMIGLNGTGLGPVHWTVLDAAGVTPLVALIAFGLGFAYLMPNSAQFMTRFTPALEWPTWEKLSPPLIRITWKPTVAWSIGIGALLMLAAAFIGRGSTSFVYFGF